MTNIKNHRPEFLILNCTACGDPRPQEVRIRLASIVSYRHIAGCGTTIWLAQENATEEDGPWEAAGDITKQLDQLLDARRLEEIL